MQLGKLLVFESGKVKLQLGGVLMDVSLGSQCMSAQHLMAVNVEGKSAMIVGEVAHRAVCTPDMDQLLGYLSYQPPPQTTRKHEQSLIGSEG